MNRPLVIVLIAAFTSCASASAPQPIAAELEYLKQVFEGQSSTGWKIRMAAIAPSVSIDPPPSLSSFESQANVIITMDSVYAYELIQGILGGLSKTRWLPVGAPGYGRVKYCVVDPNGKTYINILIEREHSLVCSAGKWYRIDSKTIKEINAAFASLLSESVKER